jgi:hypothetical protein
MKCPHCGKDTRVDLMVKAGMIRSEVSGGVVVYWAKYHDRGD